MTQYNEKKGKMTQYNEKKGKNWPNAMKKETQYKEKRVRVDLTKIAL